MDWLYLFKMVIQLTIQYLNMSFVFNGHVITVGAVIVFSALVGLVIYILRGLSN